MTVRTFARALGIAASVVLIGSGTPALAQLSGSYRIVARHSGKAVVVEGASTANAADVIQWTYTANAPANDEWDIIDLGTGYHRIVNRHSGKVLNVSGAGTADGANVDQWSWANVPQQMFQLVPIDGAPTPTPTPGNTYRVTSLAALQSRIDAARPGDTILLENGTYTTSATINVSRSGTASAPIVIAAETIGGVTINGSAGFNVNSPAQHVTIRGFRFFHAGPMRLRVGTRFCRVTRNLFENAGDTSYLVVDGDDTQVDHNEFRNKDTVGQMLKIGGASTRPAERTWAHHNYFHDFTNIGRNGGETIQVAVGENSMRHAHSVIEYNLFVRCSGENEMISNKSGSNVYRGNTFRDSPGGELTLRDGDNVTIEGNFFFNTAGTRLFGDNHRVYDNYFEGCSIAILVGSGTDPDHILGQPFGGYDQVSNLRLSHNTLVNNTRHLVFQTRRLGAVAPRIANNIVQGNTGTLVAPGDPLTNPTWEGNILWGSAADGFIPRSGFRREDPRLRSTGGAFHLSPDSPAIDAAVGSYPEVAIDMDGQPRSGAKDVGADETSSAPVRRRPLTTADVGPNAP